MKKIAVSAREKMGLSQTLEDFHQLVSQIVSLKRKSRRVMVTDAILITMEMMMMLVVVTLEIKGNDLGGLWPEQSAM